MTLNSGAGSWKASYEPANVHYLMDKRASGPRLGAALKHHGFQMLGSSKILSDECPGVAWKPITRSGRIDRAGTLHKVVQARREEIAKRDTASFA
jgi:hypothetical protein